MDIHKINSISSGQKRFCYGLSLLKEKDEKYFMLDLVSLAGILINRFFLDRKRHPGLTFVQL